MTSRLDCLVYIHSIDNYFKLLLLAGRVLISSSTVEKSSYNFSVPPLKLLILCWKMQVLPWPLTTPPNTK